MSEDLLPFLQQIALFQSFSKEELQQLLPFFRVKAYEKSDVLIPEEEIKGDVLFLKKGKAEFIKKMKIGFSRIETLHPGDWFGEIFVGAEKREVSLRPLEKIEVVFLSVEEMGSDPALFPLFQKIVAGVTFKMRAALKETEEGLIRSLVEKTLIDKVHAETGDALIFAFAFLMVYLTVFVVLPPSWKEAAIVWGTSFAVLLMACLSAFLMRRSGSSLQHFGLTWKGGWKHAGEAVLFSLPILGALFLLKWFFVLRIPAFQEMPFIEENFGKGLGILGVYLIFAPLQEFVVRGFLQTTLRTFFRGPRRVFWAILLSNMLFEIFHIPAGIGLSLGSFFLGLFWGWLYERQKSLLGPSLSHYLIGSWGMLVLNLPGIVS